MRGKRTKKKGATKVLSAEDNDDTIRGSSVAESSLLAEDPWHQLR